MRVYRYHSALISRTAFSCSLPSLLIFICTYAWLTYSSPSHRATRRASAAINLPPSQPCAHQKSEKGVWNTQNRCPRASPAVRARLSMSQIKKWLRFPECPRGGGALERVCFCLFIGSDGWSLMACDYTTSWQSNALRCRREQRGTISARLAKIPDWLWRGERYTRYNLWLFVFALLNGCASRPNRPWISVLLLSVYRAPQRKQLAG